MCWITTANNKPLDLNSIPVNSFSDIRDDLIERCKNHERVIGFFGIRDNDDVKLYIVLANDENSKIMITTVLFRNGDKRFNSITEKLPSFNLFEREFYEEFGIKPDNHPWLKPVRYGFNRYDKSLKIGDYPFLKAASDFQHEVGVGPVHAGVIEPGHFRFVCHGEKVHHLEIQLGYQHRGVEELFLKGDLKNKISLNIPPTPVAAP